MNISMYQAAVPPLIHTLSNLVNILEKGLTHTETKKIAPDVLINTRLYPDMFPLKKQVQIACDISKKGVARLAQMEAPVTEDNEASLAELITRVKTTIAYLQTFTPSQIDNTESNIIELPIGGNTLTFEGMPFLLYFVLPNVYFHVTTTYDILRHCGVELGKMDFLGKP